MAVLDPNSTQIGKGYFKEQFLRATQPEPDLPDIITFAEHESFCGKNTLYPRQKTLLRLIYLDTEHMTAYDIETINEWAENFFVGEQRVGVPPDIWKRIAWLKENGYRHFREVEFIGGRRGGKGHIGAICGAYEAWRMLMLDNPQQWYGIDKTKDIYLFTFATTAQQAKLYQFADLSNTINTAPCFQPYISEKSNNEYKLYLTTPADLRRIQTNAARRKKMDREIASVRLVAQSSNSRASRGAATFTLIFDEFAHMMTGTQGPATAEEVYKASTPSLDQFGKDGFIYIPTSPYTKVGQAYQIYVDAIETNEDDGEPKNPDMLVIQLPSWGPYVDWDDNRAITLQQCLPFKSAPQHSPDEDPRQAREEERNPDSFKVEKRAQWAEVINAYLNPKIVDRMFAPLQFDNEGMFLGSQGYISEETQEKVFATRELEIKPFGILHWNYRGHVDPSESGANMAVAFGHAEPFKEKDGDTWWHIIIDWMHVWKPHEYADHQLPYDDILDEIAERIKAFPTMEVFSVDQFSALPTLSRLKRKLGNKPRLIKEMFSDTSNRDRMERFKSALGMNWVHSWHDPFGDNGTSLLEQELKFLQVVNGKIQKQEIGPVTTKDLADCVMLLTSDLLKDQIDRLDQRETLNTPVRTGAQGGYHTNQTQEAVANHKGAPRTMRGALDAHTNRARRARGGGYQRFGR